MTNDVRKLTEHFCDKKETPTPLTISKEEKEKATRQVAGHLRQNKRIAAKAALILINMVQYDDQL